MKKLMIKSLLVVFLFTLTTNVFGQVSVEGVNINELDIDYCKIVGYNKSVIGVKIVVTVDYGQKYSFFKSQKIQDSSGKEIVFKSTIDALNFMSKNGWEYVNNYAISSSNGSIYHYLLKKKK